MFIYFHSKAAINRREPTRGIPPFVVFTVVNISCRRPVYRPGADKTTITPQRARTFYLSFVLRANCHNTGVSICAEKYDHEITRETFLRARQGLSWKELPTLYY